MRHAHALIALTLLLAPPALAQADQPRPVGQIALLPIGDSGREDIVGLVKTHWRPYFQTQDPLAFDRDSVRAGRFDLDHDGRAELVVMITKTGWEAENGFPLVVAVWTDKGWNAIGWSWGDQDTVFPTDQIIANWRTIDTGTQYLRWDRGLYGRIEKN